MGKILQKKRQKPPKAAKICQKPPKMGEKKININKNA